MRDARYLLLVFAGAAIVLTLLWFGLAVSVGFVAVGSSKPPSAPSVAQIAALVTVICVPVGAGAWWIFRKLQNRWQRREALAVTISFVVFSPLSLAVAIPLSAIPAGYAGNLWGPLLLIGAFVSIVLIVWLVTFLPSAFILWLLRRLRPAE